MLAPPPFLVNFMFWCVLRQLILLPNICVERPANLELVTCSYPHVHTHSGTCRVIGAQVGLCVLVCVFVYVNACRAADTSVCLPPFLTSVSTIWPSNRRLTVQPCLLLKCNCCVCRWTDEWGDERTNLVERRDWQFPSICEKLDELALSYFGSLCKWNLLFC